MAATAIYGRTPKQVWRLNKRRIARLIRQRIDRGGTRGVFHRGNKAQAFINRD